MTKDQSRQKNDNYDNKRGKSQKKACSQTFLYTNFVLVIIYILFVKSTNRIQQRIKNYKL